MFGQAQRIPVSLQVRYGIKIIILKKGDVKEMGNQVW